jgi:hypothetical protein
MRSGYIPYEILPEMRQVVSKKKHEEGQKNGWTWPLLYVFTLCSKCKELTDINDESRGNPFKLLESLKHLRALVFQ